MIFSVLICAALHVLEINQAVTEPDEGLVLGNGDLSVSVYQTADDIVFRFGKGDVWDRRIQTGDPVPPCTLRDYTDIALGRKAPGKFTTRAAGLSKPYPMPKPVGELRLHLPTNLPGFPEFRQWLDIEAGLVTVTASWRNGVEIAVEAVVDPEKNEFALGWRATGWDETTRTGRGEPPVYFTLEREADPKLTDFLEREAGRGMFYSVWKQALFYPDCDPLPAPTVHCDPTNAFHYVEQAFYPDNLFPDGFKCRMTLGVQKDSGRVSQLLPCGRKAMLRFYGWSRDTSGSLNVKVTTTRDVERGGAWPEPGRQQPFERYYKARARQAAERYWTTTGAFSIPGDPALERLWYATYHLRRSILRGGTVPPGLFFPSSLGHFSHWNGDYHSNYNMESIYWGDYTANHLVSADAYFDCVDFFLPLGRRIARESYGCRGVFVQLQGYPIRTEEDYNGRLTLGRMVYMTGWAMTRYWEHYLYTLDKEWLARRGYPLMKECALFYLDLLKKAPHPDLPPNLKDGKYHVFPSVAGESALGKDPMRLCDQWSPLAFSRHALWAAAQAAGVLGVDAELAAAWRDRAEHLVGPGCGAKGYDRHCIFNSQPEFLGRRYEADSESEFKNAKTDRERWYFGLEIRDWMGRVRKSRFSVKDDWPRYRKLLDGWSRPNGTIRAMSVQHYGRPGAWTETLSAMAPLQETLLQSWDGAIRLFPYWPKDRDVSFRNWRAQGAFHVSASFAGGRIASVEVTSEKGAPCLVWDDWTVTDAQGRAVPTDHDEFGRLRFRTTAGETYRLVPRR